MSSGAYHSSLVLGIRSSRTYAAFAKAFLSYLLYLKVLECSLNALDKVPANLWHPYPVDTLGCQYLWHLARIGSGRVLIVPDPQAPASSSHAGARSLRSTPAVVARMLPVCLQGRCSTARHAKLMGEWMDRRRTRHALNVMTWNRDFTSLHRQIGKEVTF